MTPRIDATSPIWLARTLLSELLRAEKSGQATSAQVNAAAEAYIAAIRAHAKATGRKLPVPSRAHVVRALA